MAAPRKSASIVRTNLGGSGKIFFGSLCAGTFGLGCWQLDRLLQKWDAIDERTEQLGTPPVRYRNDAQPRALPYRRRLLRGRLRHDKEVLIGPRGAPPGVRMPVSGLSAAKNKANGTATATVSGMQPGPQGFYVLTPMEVADDGSNATRASSVVWVNRGWVPKTMVPGANRPHYKNDPVRRAQLEEELRKPVGWNRPEGVVELTAIVCKPESEFLDRIGSDRMDWWFGVYRCLHNCCLWLRCLWLRCLWLFYRLLMYRAVNDGTIASIPCHARTVYNLHSII